MWDGRKRKWWSVSTTPNLRTVVFCARIAAKYRRAAVIAPGFPRAWGSLDIILAANPSLRAQPRRLPRGTGRPYSCRSRRCRAAGGRWEGPGDITQRWLWPSGTSTPKRAPSRCPSFRLAQLRSQGRSATGQRLSGLSELKASASSMKGTGEAGWVEGQPRAVAQRRGRERSPDGCYSTLMNCWASAEVIAHTARR